MNLRTRFIYASMLVGVVAIVGAIFYGIKSGLITPGAEVVTYTPGLYGSENITAGRENVVLAATGNVGIGTQSPSVPLHVMANGNGEAIAIQGRASDGAGTLKFWNNDRSKYANLLYYKGNLAFDGANIGIGTLNPQAKLEVSGGAIVNQRTSDTVGFGSWQEINARYQFGSSYW